MDNSATQPEAEKILFFTESETDSSPGRNSNSSMEKQSLLRSLIPFKKSKPKLCRRGDDKHQSLSSKSSRHVCTQECVVASPLHFAARRGRFREVKRLLEDPTLDLDPMGVDTCHQRTPLHYAASVGMF